MYLFRTSTSALISCAVDMNSFSVRQFIVKWLDNNTLSKTNTVWNILTFVNYYIYFFINIVFENKCLILVLHLHWILYSKHKKKKYLRVSWKYGMWMLSVGAPYWHRIASTKSKTTFLHMDGQTWQTYSQPKFLPNILAMHIIIHILHRIIVWHWWRYV